MLLSRILLQSTAFQPWSNLGPAVSGNYSSVSYPMAISMNADGTVVAIGNSSYNNGNGIAQVFAWNGTSWIQRGSDFTSQYSWLGYNVSLNDIGDRVAITLPYWDECVTVYQWNSSTSTWTKLGNDILQDAGTDDRLGYVKLNSIGNRLIIGVDTGNSAGQNTGYVKMYQLIGSTWSVMGSRINGEASWDLVGQSISMNEAGDVIAFGSYANNSYSGYFKVFYWNNTSWIQRGSTTRGVLNQRLGDSVALNGAGDILAVSSSDPERIQVLQWNGSSWVQKGNPIYEPDSIPNIDFGGDTEFNAVGDKIVIGSSWFNDSTGRATVFSWDGSNWNKYGLSIEGSSPGERLGTWVAMSSSGNTIALSRKHPSIRVLKYT